MAEMNPADVPTELVRAALAVRCTYCSLTVGREPISAHEQEVRGVLAAVLSLYRQQVSEQLKLTTQWGVRHEHADDGMPIITWQRTEQQARSLYVEIHAYDDTARLVRRELGEWREAD